MNLYSNIKAGKLRFKIDIVSRSQVQDAAGGVVGADAVLFVTDCPCDIESVSPTEVYNALQVTAKLTHNITMRWLPGIKASMDVVFREGTSPEVVRVFTIVQPYDPDERHHVLHLLCLEREDSAYTVAGT